MLRMINRMKRPAYNGVDPNAIFEPNMFAKRIMEPVPKITQDMEDQLPINHFLKTNDISQLARHARNLKFWENPLWDTYKHYPELWMDE